MTRWFLVPVSVLALVELVSAPTAHAGPVPPLPQQPAASLYLSGTRVKVTDHLSNSRKSCQWNLDCVDGLPRTHTQDEDALGRVGGWMSFAEWDGKQRRQMTFTLYWSAYATPDQAAAAAADFDAQLTGKRFGLSPFSCPSFVTGTDARQ